MMNKTRYVLIPIMVVLAIFITWFFYLFCDRKAINVEYETYVIVQDSTGEHIYMVADTAYDFIKRVDRIEKEVCHLRDNYQSEVDLMIDKTNGWLAFWIGVLALVIGLMSIWQIYRQNKSENNFYRLESNLDKNIEYEISKATSTIDEEIKGFDKQIKAMQKTMTASKLSSLMMCLSSFPDPQMTADSADKKRQMYVVLQHISKTFHEYVGSYNNGIKEQANEIENNAYLVLTVLKLAVVRTHGVYSDIHQNIIIQRLLDYIEDTNRNILNGKIAGSLHNRIKKIDMDLGDLLRVIEV